MSETTKAPNAIDGWEDAPVRSWIALSHDQSRVVAIGVDYGEVVDRAEAAGESNPVITIKSDPGAIQMLFL